MWTINSSAAESYKQHFASFITIFDTEVNIMLYQSSTWSYANVANEAKDNVGISEMYMQEFLWYAGM